jgi:Zn-dependent protease
VADVLFILAIAIPAIFAITLHEAAHGFVARSLGDDTAARLGRVTLNPIKHIDLVGTILLPAMLIATSAPFLFGWAKPVPVNFGQLGHPRRDMVLVAAAGPAMNLLQAGAAVFLLPLLADIAGSGGELARGIAVNAIVINVVLAVFNMLPIPPLDGGRVAVGLLPEFLARPLARLERVGFVIVLLVFLVLPYFGPRVGLDTDPFRWLVGGPSVYIVNFLVGLTG